MSPLPTQRTLAPIIFLKTASPHLFILADIYTHCVCIPVLYGNSWTAIQGRLGNEMLTQKKRKSVCG